MLDCLLLILRAVCCVANAEATAKATVQNLERTPACWPVCLPIKCGVAIKECCDQNNATVHPTTEHNDIELSGAPSDHAMA